MNAPGSALGSTSATKPIYKHAGLVRSSPVKLRLLALGLALCVALSPVAAADQERDDDREDRGRGMRSPTPVAIGAFEVDRDARVVQGEFVSFTYNETGISGFSVGGKRLFDLVTSEPLRAKDVRAHRAQIRLESEGLDLLVHDNPGAVTRIDADDPVRLVFVQEARIVAEREGNQFAFTLGELSGRVRGEDLRLSGTTITGDGDVLFLLDSLRSSVDKHRADISRAIGRGHVGVEASFNAVGAEVEEDVVSYGNVTVTRVKAERGNLTLLVDGHGLDGRVLVLNVDGKLVGAAKEEDLAILFDNETIQEASTLQDILDPDDDGYKPEYYVVFDVKAEAFQLLVSVPHYSVHTLSVTTVVPLPPAPVVIGIAAGIALLVPSAYLLFRRKE